MLYHISPYSNKTLGELPLKILFAVLLGIIQGVTEFLPVSSSGHLILFQELFGYEAPLFFDIMLHGGQSVRGVHGVLAGYKRGVLPSAGQNGTPF